MGRRSKRVSTRTTYGGAALVLAGAAILAAGGCSVVDARAKDALMKDLGNTSFTVFPAACRRQEMSYDENSARRLGEFITAEGLGKATVSGTPVCITGPWHMNQARMLRESAADFATHVRSSPVGTDYALLVEYLGGRSGAVGIHCYILDSTGKIAWVGLWNSAHRAFAKANLSTEEGCTDFVIQELRRQLKPATKGEQENRE